MENEEQGETKNSLVDVFNYWAILGKDEEFAIGDCPCKQFVRDHCTMPTGDFTFLDLGCSNGWMSRFTAQAFPRAKKLVGVDIAPCMIHKAQNWFTNDNPPNLEFVCSDMLEYHAPEQFDVVFCQASLYYIIPMGKAAEKLSSWLKPGGLFVAGTDIYSDNEDSLKWPSTLKLDMDIRSTTEWKKLFTEEYGLVNVNQMTINYPNEEGWGSLFTWGWRT